MISQIQEEVKKAMKSGEKARLSALRMLLSDLKKEQIDSGKELTDPTSQQILKRAIKKIKESIEQFTAGNRQDLVDKEEAQLKVLEEFAPQQLSASETEAIISKIISEVGAASKQDTGKVMKAIMSEYGGQIDGKIVQQIVSQKLT